MSRICLALMAVVGLLAAVVNVAEVSASEAEAVDRLYQHHQKQSIDTAHKLQKLRQEFKGQLERAPATLVVPLIDKVVNHMRWARAYAPNAESREIIDGADPDNYDCFCLTHCFISRN